MQFLCSDGRSGSADCSDGLSPLIVNAAASLDFSAFTDIGVTLPSLQVVSQRLLLPSSGPIYNHSWSLLAYLAAKGLSSARFVPWLAYPKVHASCTGSPVARDHSPLPFSDGRRRAGSSHRESPLWPSHVGARTGAKFAPPPRAWQTGHRLSCCCCSSLSILSSTAARMAAPSQPWTLCKLRHCERRLWGVQGV